MTQRLWFSPSELAGLPGMPRGIRAIQIQAAAKGWPSRPRAGKGGGREYALGALPADTGAWLLAKHGIAGEPTPPVQNDPAFAHLSAKQKQRADDRLAILAARDGFPGSDADFAAAYTAGNISIPDGARSRIRQITRNTLSNWRAALKSGGIPALAGRYRAANKGRGDIATNPALHDFIIAIIAHTPHANAHQIRDSIETRFKAAPALRTLQKFIADWRQDNASTLAAITNPDAWKGKYQAAFGSQSANAVAPNAIWEMDSTPADLMAFDETGQPRRLAIVGVIDVYTRRTMVLVSRTSRATALATLLRRAILAWGVPATVKTDQGADYTSQHFCRALAGLEIRHKKCAPFTPEGKPHIERFFGTLTRDLFERLPGYVGHSVAERTDIEARRSFAQRFGSGPVIQVSLTTEDLQSRCDDWCGALYANRAHRGLDGDTPAARARAWPAPLRRIDNERALDLLLAEAPGNHGRRRVGKKGIRLDRGDFIAPELGPHVGETMFVRYDPDDLGRIIVFDADGAFVCIAECPERTGLDRRAWALAARRLQADAVRASRAGARRLIADIAPGTLMDELLAAARDGSDRVTDLPRAADKYDTEALAEAAMAALAIDSPPAGAPITAEEAARADALFAEMTEASNPEPGSNASRPIFADDCELGLWLLANPDLATPAESEWLSERLHSTSFRLWLGLPPLDDQTRAATG